MDNHRTVLFQPLNHIGLGHINRLAVIALALRELDPRIRTPFVVEEAASALLDALGLPYIPFPSTHSMNEGPAWETWTEHERSALQIELSHSILRTTAPQVVVFDFLPNPIFANEVRKARIPVVLCLRETRRLAEYLPTVHELLDCARLIIIPHSDGAFGLPEQLAAKSRFVGQIAHQAQHYAVHEQGSPATEVVISGGGGGYPGTFEFYNLAMLATAILRKRYASLRPQLIAGPLFRDWPLLEPRDGIAMVPFEPYMTSRLAKADLVICQAGYNTIAELEQLTTKAVLVPAERQWDDQFARAERVVREKPNFRLFRGKTAAELAILVEEFLGEPVGHIECRKPIGGTNAAMLIRDMLDNPAS